MIEVEKATEEIGRKLEEYEAGIYASVVQILQVRREVEGVSVEEDREGRKVIFRTGFIECIK